MADINYWLTTSPLNVDYNLYVSYDLEGFSGEQWWRPQDTIASYTLVFSLSTHYPVEASSRAINCVKTQSYFDDYYNRIHISPSVLALGNVASEQVSTVDVWNAYLVAKTLQAINGVEEGLTLSGQSATPLIFTALQERRWDISIAPDGASSIDIELTWQFSNEPVVLRIIGTRIVAFGWLVDWSKPVVETLSWLTDILQSKTGHEQRRSLRLAPRINFEAELLLTAQERQYFDLVMIGWAAKTFAMPVWPQQQWLKTTHAAGSLTIYCDTTQRNFKENRLAILRGATAFDNETVEIAAVYSDSLVLKRPLLKTWPKGTCLSPAVTAQLSTMPQLIKRNDRMMRTTVSLNVIEPIDFDSYLPATTYRNYPVLEAAPNEVDDLTHSQERMLEELDNNLGLMLRQDTAAAAFGLYQYAWLTYGRLQQSELRGLFYALRGSQKAIWLPTFSDDLTVIDIIVENTQTLDISWCGYTRFALGHLGRQDIQIILKDGTVLYRRITAANEIDSTTERLSVEQSFTRQINPNDIIRISFIVLCRLSNDTLAIEHINDSDGNAKAAATFRGVREL